MNRLLIDLEGKLSILTTLLENPDLNPRRETLLKYARESNDLIQKLQKNYFDGNFENSIQLRSLFDIPIPYTGE